MGGNVHTGYHAPLPQAAPATQRNILSNRSVVEIKKCQAGRFVNVVEVQPSVGRFKVDNQDPPLHMTGSPRIKFTDVVPTIAPQCSYGVFHPGGVADRDPATDDRQ